jgi:hypothetical protein
MAQTPRKAKSAAAAPKARAPATTTPRPASGQSAQTAGGADSNRLLREAAWSRMFGRIETKNPFTR